MKLPFEIRTGEIRTPKPDQNPKRFRRGSLGGTPEVLSRIEEMFTGRANANRKDSAIGSLPPFGFRIADFGFSLVLCLALLFSAQAQTALNPAGLEAAFTYLQSYDWGNSREPLNAISAAVRDSRNDAGQRLAIEKRLVAVFESPAPLAAKDFACRELSVVGTGLSVPALARRLNDPELSHVARLALERIPDPTSAAALRVALDNNSGALKVGVINSLGEMRDVGAVKRLAACAKENNQQSAAAAILALGKIGNSDALKALQKLEKSGPEHLQPTITDALLNGAWRMTGADGNKAAARIFENSFRHATHPRVRLSAFRGLVKANPKQATRRLSDAFASDDEALPQIAAQLVAQRTGTDALAPFLKAFNAYPAAGKIAVLEIARRNGDATARAVALKAMNNSESQVRVAAIRALAGIGTAEEVGKLAELSSRGSQAEREAAQFALANLPGTKPNAVLTSLLAGANSETKIILLQALTARHATEACSKVSALVRSDSSDVQRAAIESVGTMGGEPEAAVLIDVIRSKNNAKTREAAAKALGQVVRRGSVQIDGILSGMADAPTPARAALLELLPVIGGPRALEAVRACIQSSDEDVRDAAVHALAEWPSLDAAPDLMQQVRTSSQPVWRTLCFRGYIRLVRDTEMPPQKRARLLAEAMAVAKNSDEKKQVIAALGQMKAIPGLQQVAVSFDDPEIAAESALAAINIAGRLDAKAKDDIAPVLRRISKVTQDKNILDQARQTMQRLGIKPE